MEKQIKIIGITKWLSFPLGYIMYYGTVDSFGAWAAMMLTILAASAFWALMKNEQGRLIGESIANDIRDVISEFAGVESFVEIRKFRSGILARVYLVNAREKAAFIHRSITRKLDGCAMKKYLWAMQLTDMPGKGAYEETQRLLNEQLMEEMLNRHKGEE